ncbi:MAG TPA: LLM class flavin-dependent oxidoreductase [Acidobacteriaceae bacterium]
MTQPASTQSGLPISVLDLVGLCAGESTASAIARSVELARAVESFGYTRFWLAEHHSIAGLACSATSVLIGHIAQATSSIRVGSGGIMLPNHAPLVIAEQFGTLASIYPDRIDLGLGRAPGGDYATMHALRRDLAQSGDNFPELLQELRMYLGANQPGRRVHAYPGEGTEVPITLLGSSTYSATLAAQQGLPFAFAAHFAPQSMYAAAEIYLDNFIPGKVLSQPHLILAIPVIVAETDAEARRLLTTPQQRFLRLIRNQPVESLPPIDPEAMDQHWNPIECEAVEARLAAAIVGSESAVRAGLDQLLRTTGAHEIIAVTDTFSPETRIDSYRRLAQIAKTIHPRQSVQATA